MMRCLYRSYQWTTRLTRWVARRLTPAGRLVVAVLVLATFLGTDLDRAAGPRTLLLGLILLVLAAGFSPFFRGRFRVERRLPRVASVGERLRYPVRVENCTDRRLAGLELLEELAEEPLEYAAFIARLRPTSRGASGRFTPVLRRGRVEPVALPPLNPGEVLTTHLEWVPRRRGLLHFAAVGIARTDPLGLFRSTVRVHAPQTLVVLPRRYPVPELHLSGTPKYQPGGVALASRVGESEEFLALREYRPGDPLRRIHWRSWARAGTPVTKEYQDEFFSRHALVLDTFTGPDNEEVFEEAVSVAASFAAQTRSADVLLDLLFTGDRAYRVTAGRGLAPISQLLEVLAAVPRATALKFDTLRHRVLEHAHEVTGAVCVLIGWDEERRELVEQLIARGVQLHVLVIVPRSQRRPPEPGPRIASAGFHVLTAGRIREDLARITSRSRV